MLVLGRAPVQVHVHANEGDVTFPAEVILKAELGPPEFFGVAPLSGTLGLARAGQQVEIARNDFRGPNRLMVKGALERHAFESGFLGVPFQMDGNVATFRFTVESLAGLDKFSAYVESMFPALFSGMFCAPLEIEAISGILGGHPFTVHGAVQVSHPIYILPNDPNDVLKRHFDANSPKNLPPIFVMSAARYLQQADRLDVSGRYYTTFVAEKVLNLAKALEAIFPSEKIDDMRALLTTLGIAEEYKEVFASIRILRNQVDVGHVALTYLQAEDFQAVLSFVDLATTCVRALVNSLLGDPAACSRLAKLRKPSEAKAPDAVTFIRRKYGNLRPPKYSDLTKVPGES